MLKKSRLSFSLDFCFCDREELSQELSIFCRHCSDNSIDSFTNFCFHFVEQNIAKIADGLRHPRPTTFFTTIVGAVRGNQCRDATSPDLRVSRSDLCRRFSCFGQFNDFKLGFAIWLSLSCLPSRRPFLSRFFCWYASFHNPPRMWF